jgi:hypothetical protein
MKIKAINLTSITAGFCALANLSLAHGDSSGHMSADLDHGVRERYEHHRYSDDYFGWPYPDYAWNYDSNYSYIPTPEQLARAQERVEKYLLAVKKHRKHAPTHRYVSVETLRPTKQQIDDYTKHWEKVKSKGGSDAAKLAEHQVDPSQLHCLMVFDTQSKQFAGSGCYLVSTEPPIGQITTFQTVSAEFVGEGAL